MPAASAERFSLEHLPFAADDFGASVRAGLTAPRKTLEPRFFYDALGSALFDAICELPEYYVTRSETAILTEHAAEIVAAFGSPVRLVELGSGSARKTRLLFDALLARQKTLDYAPIDVDAGMLEKSGRALLVEYAGLRVSALRGDFREPSRALAALPATRERTIVLFLGSSIGNLDPTEAVAMLRDLRGALREGDALFLGVDLRKAKSVLEPAYDDALGVTAAFNLNLLQRINRELGGEFDLARFAHAVAYDEQLGRIEMHLVSLGAQTVRIGDYEVSFADGETIHTENSWKYDQASLAALAAEAGFAVERTWTDGRFADVLMR
ncbi:MAG TPA: L-histidine N(alpha)-methyltransferase [Thermoanaerobaculia bacterium]|jgi:dimethylhistidine N-methyltransferase|nr:L-histidine N(alpha)-methyltransferase [Thermoanaerobaculia bacterium]